MVYQHSLMDLIPQAWTAMDFLKNSSVKLGSTKRSAPPPPHSPPYSPPYSPPPSLTPPPPSHTFIQRTQCHLRKLLTHHSTQTHLLESMGVERALCSQNFVSWDMAADEKQEHMLFFSFLLNSLGSKARPTYWRFLSLITMSPAVS